MDNTSTELTRDVLTLARSARRRGLSYVDIREELDESPPYGALIDGVQTAFEYRDVAAEPIPKDEDEPWTDIALVRELYADRDLNFTEMSDVLNCHYETAKLWAYQASSHVHRLEIRCEDGQFVFEPPRFHSPVRIPVESFFEHSFVEATEFERYRLDENGETTWEAVSAEEVAEYDPESSVFEAGSSEGVAIVVRGLHAALREFLGGIPDDVPVLDGSGSEWCLVPSTAEFGADETFPAFTYREHNSSAALMQQLLRAGQSPVSD